MSTRAQTITKGRTLPPNARRVCSKALFAARGGARTPLRATETRALLRARYFFFLSGLFERRGRRRRRRRGADEAKDKNFGKREEKNQFFFLKERELKDTGLYKKRRTLFFRAVLFE